MGSAAQEPIDKAAKMQQIFQATERVAHLVVWWK